MRKKSNTTLAISIGALGALLAIPVMWLGSLVFTQNTPPNPAPAKDNSLVSGTIDYGSRG